MTTECSVTPTISPSSLQPCHVIATVQLQIDLPVRPCEVEFDRILTGQPDDVMQFGLREIRAGEIA